MLLFIVRVKQSIILLPAVFDDKVIQCIILFTLNVVTFKCVLFPNPNKIKHVYKKYSIIMGDYQIFSQSGGRCNLKVHADSCVEVRLDSGTS